MRVRLQWFVRARKHLSRRVRSGIFSRTYRLKSIEDYFKERGWEVRDVLPPEQVIGIAPQFFLDREFDVADYGDRQASPGVRLMSVRESVVVGRTEFVLLNGCALFPRPFQPGKHVFMLEIEGRAKVSQDRSNISMWLRSRELKVPSAISLLGQCSGNYAHWVLEVLTRLVIVDSIPELSGIPILVDGPIHSSLRRSLDVLNLSEREIIEVSSAQRVRVGQLYILTSPSFTPPETREFFETGVVTPVESSSFQFSPVALALLRRAAVRSAQVRLASSMFDLVAHGRESTDTLDRSSFASEYIFLNRVPGTAGNGRYLVNTLSVERLLKSSFFETLNIAELPFELQVVAVQRARVVFVTIGAAAINLIFSPPGLTVVLLSPIYSGANWFYWSNLMIAAGHRLIVVTGGQVGSRERSLYHRDYWVRVDLVAEVLSELGFRFSGKSP